MVNALVLAACLTGLAAGAGVRVEQEQREPDTSAVLGLTVFYLDAGRLRIEAQTAEGDKLLVIFHSDKPVAWTIDLVEGTYYELTPAKIAKMREQMDRMQREMAEALKQLPPEQRRAAEQMMEQMGQTPGPPQPTTVRVVGRDEKVEPFVCVRYEVLQGGTREKEIWAAPLDQLQLRPEEHQTLVALVRLFEPLGPQTLATRLSGLAPSESGGEKIEGLPVRTLSYENGRAFAEERVVRAERQSFDPSLFELPPGLRLTEMEEEGNVQP
jgi:hypothetical protein